MRYIKTYIGLLAALLTVFTVGKAYAQEGLLKAELDKDSILIGDHVVLTLTFAQDNSHQVGLPVFKDAIFPGIELVEERPFDTIKEAGKQVMMKKSFVVTSFDSATYSFPIPYILQRGAVVDTLFTNPVELYVNTIPVDTATYHMFDIKAQVEYPRTFKEVLPLLLIILAALLLIGFGIYMYIRWKKQKPLFSKPKKVEPPYVVAVRELQRLKDEKAWRQDRPKQYYTKLTDIFRVYVESSFSIHAMEKTSQEILDQLEGSELERKYPLAKLVELFSLSDLAKFAKYIPAPDENERAYLTVAEFVEATKPAADSETDSDDEGSVEPAGKDIPEAKKQDSTDL